MFQQKRLRGDGSYAARADELRAGDQEMDGEDEQVTHEANGTITTGMCKTARRGRIASHYEFALHRVHPEDLAKLIDVGLRAEYLCEIVYGVSHNARSWWDNRRAETLGYRPSHSADPFADSLSDIRSDDPVCELYQRGAFAAQGYSGDPERAAHSG